MENLIIKLAIVVDAIFVLIIIAGLLHYDKRKYYSLKWYYQYACSITEMVAISFLSVQIVGGLLLIIVSYIVDLINK